MPLTLRATRSVCPVCLEPVDARLTRHDDGVHMEKSCPKHGGFSVPVWHDKASLEDWRGAITGPGVDVPENCPHECAGCGGHTQGTCCALLEVTQKCNLKCRYCFAEGGADDATEPSLSALKLAIESILRGEDKPLLQFSGGEPTLRDDLPELVAFVRKFGCRYTQLNSNGLRLAEDEAYVKALADAGLSFVFLQFDGIDDGVHTALRGAPLHQQKLRAIQICGTYNIGVALVPTIVPGINDHQIGDIIRLGASLSPAVRGVHFQPVSYFGRYPGQPPNGARYTLDDLFAAIGSQTDISLPSLTPSRCDHPLCGFHGSFLVNEGTLTPLVAGNRQVRTDETTARQNREYVGRHWEREPEAEDCCSDSSCGCSDYSGAKSCCDDAPKSFDGFLRSVKKHGFTLSAMAFQDAMNLDLERLRRCSLHVYHEGILKPFCARYLTAIDSR